MSAIGLAHRRTESAETGGALRVTATVLAWAIGGFVVGISALMTIPTVMGFRTLTVVSGSMEPTIHVGDVVLVRQIAPLDARVGDIITFKDPEDPAKLITHRVRDIQATGSTVQVVTKGDANTSVERWTAPVDATIGRVEYRLPRLGIGLFWARGRFGQLLLIVVPAIGLGVLELVRIWRPEPKRSGRELGF